MKLSLVTYPKSTSDVSESENLLLPIAKEVNDYWQPIKTWTSIALAISQNGLALSAASMILLMVLVIYRLILNLQEKSSLLILYNKLPTKNQLLIKAVQNATKQGIPTTMGIAEELVKQTSSPVDIEKLKEELKDAKQVGLIETDLLNKEDKPTLAWKSLLPNHNRLYSLPIVSIFFKY